MRNVICLMILTSFVSGCVAGVPSGEALCSGTAQTRTAHAAALADDGGPKSMATGARLIALVDGACH